MEKADLFLGLHIEQSSIGVVLLNPLGYIEELPHWIAMNHSRPVPTSMVPNS